jgi:hypothetical protein
VSWRVLWRFKSAPPGVGTVFGPARFDTFADCERVCVALNRQNDLIHHWPDWVDR